MRHIRCELFFLVVIFLCGLIVSVPVRSETPQKEAEKVKARPAEPHPIFIKSDTLEVDNRLKVVTFTGEVNARRDDFVLDCRKMLVYYESVPGQEEIGEAGTRINKIVATGEVKIRRIQGGDGHCGQGSVLS